MTKRSAEEALVGVNGVDNEGCVQKKESKPLPADDGGDGGCASSQEALPSHRISLISSSSSSSIAPTTSHPASVTAKALRRTVTSLGSSTDDITPQAGKKCGSDDGPDETNVRQLTRFTNARILNRDGTLQAGSMTVDPSNGLIVEISGEDGLSSIGDKIVQVVDCQGHILSPGFIDIQLNGAYGVDFSNDGNNEDEAMNATNETSSQDQQSGLTTKGIMDVAQRLVETGVTSFCPTMVSSSPQTYRRILSLMRETRKQQIQQDRNPNGSNSSIGANILGMHLEGPFFAASKRGAHDLQYITAPEKGMASVEEVYGTNQQNNEDEVQLLEDIDIVTLAPELPGAFDAIQALTNPSATNSKGVVVSCGHTEATYDDGIQALSHGATLLTHLYNAMNPFHHRKPGLVGLLSSEAKLGRMGLNRPFFSMIVDGIHVHESAVCMAYLSHPNGCVLVTDAMTAMGLGDGEHSLGNMKVCIKGDRAVLAGTDTLAGSVVSMDTCVKRFRKFTSCAIGKALLCATLHPAKVLTRHVARKKRIKAGGGVADAPIGILEAGAKADIVMVNDELDVLGTWIHGQLAFQKK